MTVSLVYRLQNFPSPQVTFSVFFNRSKTTELNKIFLIIWAPTFQKRKQFFSQNVRPFLQTNMAVISFSLEIARIFMYLRAIFCTFQISVDFYYVPVGGRGGGRGLECILYGYT
jgi:hypothetical protein